MVFRPFVALLAAVLLVAVAAVAEDEKKPVNPLGKAVNPLGKAATAKKEEEVLAVGHGLALALVQATRASRDLVVESLFAATLLSGDAARGRVRLTGTLAPGLDGKTAYRPRPTDRLVVVTGGEKHVFTVLEATGPAGAQTPGDWTGGTHSIRYRHVIGERASVEISDETVGARFTFRTKGTVTHPDFVGRYETDLTAAGVYSWDSDSSGHELETSYDITGTVTRPGVHLTVKEHQEFNLVSAAASGTSATRSSCRIESKLRFGEDRYEWLDAAFQKTFTGGYPSYPRKQWLSQGFILKNDRKWGKYGHSLARQFVGPRRRLRCTLRVFVTTPSGEVVLERHRYYWQ